MVLLCGGCGGGGDSATSSRATPARGVTAWSDPATWGGTKPVAGASVLIPAGFKVELDEAAVEVDELIVEGDLSLRQGLTTELKASVVRVRGGGALRAGTEAEPFTGRATITLTGVETGTTDAMGTRGILVSGGGRLELYGVGPAQAWTRLNAHATAGATSLQLEQPVNWQAGDQIVVAPTAWYPNGGGPVTTERVTLAGASGTALTLATGIVRPKWGRLQYVTDTGMSATPGTFTKPHPDAVDTLDERAEVGNLSRNIVIQGADDAQWQNNGFGAQVMVMDRSSMLRLDSVELRRVGQEGKVGRYPVHWHLLSYPDGGTTELGDATGHFVRNSSVWNSRHRCLVLHGTNGVTLQNNICYDIRGHAIFIEDAVERRNVIEGNLVLKVRSPAAGKATVAHEAETPGCGASSAYWLTNPDNTVRNNVAADAEGHGFWLSYPEAPVKQGKSVQVRPNNLKHGVFEFNSSHSNGMNGLQLECAMADDAGNLVLMEYRPTTDGAALRQDQTNAVRFTFKRITTFKNRNGYVNRAFNPDYLQWASADNVTRGFTGSVRAGSTLKHSLIVGLSLNATEPFPAGQNPQLAFASYHSTLDITENTIVNITSRGYSLAQVDEDVSSGTFGTDDYYVQPVEKGFKRNPGNKLIKADPGYRALPAHLQPGYTAATNRNWTLAGAVWDPQGYWTTPNRWLVFDTPFLSGAGCTNLVTNLTDPRPNGLSCPGPYFGVTPFGLNLGLPGDTSGPFLEKIQVQRLDAAYNAIPGAEWNVEQGYTSIKLGHMRHFAALQGGNYILRFPEFAHAVKWVSLALDNIRDPGDNMMLAVQFDGATPPGEVLLSTNLDFSNAANSRLLTPAASRAAVAAGTGTLYWQDTANNLIWVKLTPLGLNAWPGVPVDSDLDLYRRYLLRIKQ